MNKINLTPETVICRGESLLSNNLGDDVVMMDIEKGEYYGLEEVAASIWKLIEEPVTVASLSEQLMNDYDVSPERCEKEVSSFLGDLIERKIARIVE